MASSKAVLASRAGLLRGEQVSAGPADARAQTPANLGHIQNLIVEDAEVECKAQSDGVGGWQVLFDRCLGRLPRATSKGMLGGARRSACACLRGRAPVRTSPWPSRPCPCGPPLRQTLRGSASSRPPSSNRILGPRPSCLPATGTSKDVEQLLADLLELLLHLLPVARDERHLFVVTLLLLLRLNAAKHTPRRTAGAHNVLVGN